MNILHISAVKNWGGGENHIENLCNELNRISPTINNRIFCVQNGQFHKKLSAGNIEVISAKLSFKMDPRFIVKLGKICSREKIDLIHIHDSTALALAVVADRFYELPDFIFSKKTSFPIKNRKQTLFKYNYHKIKKILCVSEVTKKVVQKQIQDLQKLETIYHGTNIKNSVEKAPFSLRSKYNIPKEKKIIGNIANHIGAKSLETFLEVANEIVNIKNRKDFFFIQLGNFTEHTPKLREIIKKFKLEEHVIMMGFTPNASQFIPEFDLSLVTSKIEGIPQFIFESFYHKIPVISTNVGGIAEAIVHKENGLLAEKFDHQKLASEILFLDENPELQQEFVLNSHQKLTDCFNTEIMAEKTLSEYKKVIDGRS